METQLEEDKLNRRHHISCWKSHNNFATFLDLPGELRNEVYPSVLRYDAEQYIKLKLKLRSDGKSYIKAPHPPLWHAVPVPQIRDEVLSVYYSENRFRTSIKTKRQRNVFRGWVEQCGSVLDGLKILVLQAKVRTRCTISKGKRELEHIVSISQLVLGRWE